MNRFLLILFVIVIGFMLIGCTDNRNLVEISLFDQCKKINNLNCEKLYKNTYEAFISDGKKSSIINDVNDPFGTVKSVFVIEDASFKLKYPNKKSISDIYFDSTGKKLFENSVSHQENKSTEKVETERAGVRFVDDFRKAVKMCGNPEYSDTIEYNDYIPITLKRKLEDFSNKCKESSIEKSMVTK